MAPSTVDIIYAEFFEKGRICDQSGKSLAVKNIDELAKQHHGVETREIKLTGGGLLASAVGTRLQKKQVVATYHVNRAQAPAASEVLQRFCTKCRSMLGDEAVFCGACGTRRAAEVNQPLTTS